MTKYPNVDVSMLQTGNPSITQKEGNGKKGAKSKTMNFPSLQNNIRGIVSSISMAAQSLTNVMVKIIYYTGENTCLFGTCST